MAHRTFRSTFVVFISSFLLLFMHCKTQSTAPQTPNTSADNKISVSCIPSTGGTGTEVTVTVTINKNQRQIKAFGLEITFDSAVFQYLSTGKGILTASWASVDGNETGAGKLIVGGFGGSGTPVAIGSSGILFQVKFKVIYAGSSDSFTSQITIKNYLDDISGMTPASASVAFAYKK